MIEKIGQRYLIILIIINVVFLIFDVGIILYANIELSNNLEDFIHVHLNMKNSIIMLLFVKSKFIVNKNKIDKFKYFNFSSILQNKNKKLNYMWMRETLNTDHDELYKIFSENKYDDNVKKNKKRKNVQKRRVRA